MQIFGIEIDKIKYDELLIKLQSLEKQNIIFTPNPEILLKVLEDREFKNLINRADYRTIDGIGLYLAFQILDNKYWKFFNTIFLAYYIFNILFRRKHLYNKYWERICWSDLTKDLIDYSENAQIKIAIIDLYNPTDEKKVKAQEEFSNNLQKKFPKLKFDYYIYNIDKKEEIIEQIGNSDAKILFSTLWMKKQEESIFEVMWKAKNIKIWLGIGSSFDYFIWFQKRAPEIWRKLGFEWLYRLFTWPRKLNRLKRLFNAVIVFPFMVILLKKKK